MNRLAIFDCDGTLVDSGATIHRALVTTFDAHSLVCPPRHEAQRVIGLSLEEAMQVLAPQSDSLRLSATYREAFVALRQLGEVEEPLFEGIVELLAALEADGWLLGVATGKSRRGLDHVLDCHGWDGRFVTLQTADTNPSKPAPAMAIAAMAEAGAGPDTTVLIGDTAWDMGCARSAGCGAIGAGWGYHSADELLGAGATAVVDHPRDVPPLLEAGATGQ